MHERGGALNEKVIPWKHFPSRGGGEWIIPARPEMHVFPMNKANRRKAMEIH
jgi:hypothetical protein